ncbi:hypothetical protein [Rhodohalobacter halophilus]|uniref:hypothetical protein n=1 Tax=Rhodohalobacter halophilus TaxID=1812810 RepID=UPI00083F60ED|nr:hypothetical protein [Rhodohalobacter halophilus]
MKTITAILLFIFFAVLDGPDNSEVIGFQCPSNHEKAEEVLHEYLESERAIEDLRRQYNMNIDHTSYTKINALKNELNQTECERLIESLNLSEDDRLHSFYKVADHYFIVNYKFSEVGEFEYSSITITSKRYEAIAVVLNWDRISDYQ